MVGAAASVPAHPPAIHECAFAPQPSGGWWSRVLMDHVDQGAHPEGIREKGRPWKGKWRAGTEATAPTIPAQ